LSVPSLPSHRGVPSNSEENITSVLTWNKTGSSSWEEYGGQQLQLCLC